MSIYFYITSIFMALSVFILSCVSMFADEESYFFRMFGDTEIFFCLGVSLVLLVIGVITDLREDKE